METIAAMREHPGTAGTVGKPAALCEQAELGTDLAAAAAAVALPRERPSRRRRRGQPGVPNSPGSIPKARGGRRLDTPRGRV
jgi:hypothetical protein